jgi:hypothetical protein
LLGLGARFGKTASPSAFNNTIGTLRLVLDIAVEAGARYDNPAVHIKRKKIRQKQLQLPSQKQFVELITTIRKGTAAGRNVAPTWWNFWHTADAEKVKRRASMAGTAILKKAKSRFWATLPPEQRIGKFAASR